MRVRDAVSAAVAAVEAAAGPRIAAAVSAAVTAARAQVEAGARLVAIQAAEDRRLEDKAQATRLASEEAGRAERLRVEETGRAAREAVLVKAVEDRVHADWADGHAENKATAAKLDAKAAELAKLTGRLAGRVEAFARIVPDIGLVRPGFTNQLPILASYVAYIDRIEGDRAERARVAEHDLIQRGWEQGQYQRERGFGLER